MLNKKSFLYRFFVLLLVWLFLGAAIFGPLIGTGVLTEWWVYLVLGLYVLLFVLVLLINELVIRKKEKPE